MYIAWTTVATKADADRMAEETIRLNLAACVQVDGPIISHYRWEARQQSTEEYRLSFKFPVERLVELEQHVLGQHPYDNPQWIVVRAEHVAEKYLSWVKSTSTNPPL